MKTRIKPTLGNWIYRAPTSSLSLGRFHALLIPQTPKAREEGYQAQVLKTGDTLEDGANALLLSKAPELLAELESFTQNVSYFLPHDHALLMQARKVISSTYFMV